VALNIKNARVEQLAVELSELAGETKTEAIRRALEERRERLLSGRPKRDRRARLLSFLENEVWPALPVEVRGKRLTKKERERILGYGPEGV
jgi:antitoxin VapB